MSGTRQPKHSIGRGRYLIDQRHAQHCACALEFERERAFGNQAQPEDVAEETPGAIGIGRGNEGDEWRTGEHEANITGDGSSCQPCNAVTKTYHRFVIDIESPHPAAHN